MKSFVGERQYEDKEEDIYPDTLSEMMHCTYPPGNGISVQQVSEELGNVAQLVGLQAVDCLKLLPKNILEGFHVLLVQLAESLLT